jgi:hypothetical protein
MSGGFCLLLLFLLLLSLLFCRKASDTIDNVKSKVLDLAALASKVIHSKNNNNSNTNNKTYQQQHTTRQQQQTP